MDASLILQKLLLIAQSLPAVAQLILMILGSLVVMGQAIVVASPSKEDDAAWEKIKGIPILGFLLDKITLFSVVQKKDPKVIEQVESKKE